MRSVFYGVLLTVFVAGAGYVQAANDQDYISISDEPAFKPKSTVYSDKKKKTKSSTGDDYISISDEPVITPKPSTGIADGNASAGEGATGIMHGSFSAGGSREIREEVGGEVRAAQVSFNTSEEADAQIRHVQDAITTTDNPIKVEGGALGGGEAPEPKEYTKAKGKGPGG